MPNTICLYNLKLLSNPNCQDNDFVGGGGGGVNVKLSLLFVMTNHFFSAVSLDLVFSHKRLSPNPNCQDMMILWGGGGGGEFYNLHVS